MGAGDPARPNASHSTTHVATDAFVRPPYSSVAHAVMPLLQLSEAIIAKIRKPRHITNGQGLRARTVNE